LPFLVTIKAEIVVQIQLLERKKEKDSSKEEQL